VPPLIVADKVASTVIEIVFELTVPQLPLVTEQRYEPDTLKLPAS